MSHRLCAIHSRTLCFLLCASMCDLCWFNYASYISVPICVYVTKMNSVKMCTYCLTCWHIGFLRYALCLGTAPRRALRGYLNCCVPSLPAFDILRMWTCCKWGSFSNLPLKVWQAGLLSIFGSLKPAWRKFRARPVQGFAVLRRENCVVACHVISSTCSCVLVWQFCIGFVYRAGSLMHVLCSRPHRQTKM